jgi:hypothetical protein
MLSRRAGMPLLPTGTEISAAQTDASGKHGSQDLQRGGTEEAEELKRIAIIAVIAKIAKIEKLIRNGFYNYGDFGNAIIRFRSPDSWLHRLIFPLCPSCPLWLSVLAAGRRILLTSE